MRALLLVDIQNDFCPGGSLAVPSGDSVVPVANRLASLFQTRVATQDFHPPGHSSFSEQGGPWPEHCVPGSRGAEFHPGLTVENTAVFTKGKVLSADSYSGFADDNGGETGLDAWLKGAGIEELFVMGLATDYCVKATVLHALTRGYKVQVVVDGCRGVNIRSGDSERALEEMAAAGAVLIHSSEVS
jgi:nicotinamidase/pyrazinamidase